MIGQASLFPVDTTLPLRQRVAVEIITLEQARFALEKFHYLHRVRVGRQINYAVLIDSVVDGVITFAYPMISSPIENVPSDEIIEFARMFLYQNIPHSATCAIGKVLKRIKSDWTLLFPDSKIPKLVISWSDTVFHKGMIYKAANFTWLRKSKHSGLGHYRGKDKPRTKHEDFKHEKDCWIYWLK